MATLYEIEDAILECVDLETGEIIDEERLNSLSIERDKKIESVALWYKNLLADAQAFKDEKDMFAEREKAAKNKAENLKKYLSNYLNGDKFKTTRVSISYRKSESVEITDINKIDDDYLVYSEPVPKKKEIKEAIKKGIEITGATLTENKNIQIK